MVADAELPQARASDPADAPVYVAMGLMLVGTCLGAVIGSAIGIVYCVRLTRRKELSKPS